MKNFDRLHSYTTGEFFDTWISKDRQLLIQVEPFSKEKCYGILMNSNTLQELNNRYITIPYDDRRYTTMRKCLETYYKITK